MLLICSAWEEEVKTLKAQRSKLNEESSIRTLGIGYFDAALQLNKILQDANYSRIIFLGTGGSYSKELGIGDLVSISSVSLLNLGTVLEHSYVPIEYDAYECSRLQAQHSTVSANCLSSLEITKCNQVSKKIENYYKDPVRHAASFIQQSSSEAGTIQLPLVENLELYGVAKIASEHNIPWSAFLGITNYTDANAHQDWKANQERVSEKLCESVLSKNLVS